MRSKFLSNTVMVFYFFGAWWRICSGDCVFMMAISPTHFFLFSLQIDRYLSIFDDFCDVRNFSTSGSRWWGWRWWEEVSAQVVKVRVTENGITLWAKMIFRATLRGVALIKCDFLWLCAFLRQSARTNLRAHHSAGALVDI